MTTVARCPECDARLPEGAPEGLCPRCLFDVGLGAPGAALEGRRDGHWLGEHEGRGPGAPGPTPGDELAPSNVTSAPPALPPDMEHLGPLAERFHDLTPIGRGGMGAVYRARDSRLGRTVAIKVLMPELLREDPTFAGRFEREAQALARLDHPNIVKVHDAGQADGLYYLVMEHVDGGSLRRAMQDGPVPPADVARILSGLCDAVAYAHAAGVIHRDIKPENVLLDRTGRVRLADFGLAKVTAGTLARSLTGSREAMGTPCYMAPEQLRDPLSVDHRADIYAIGVLAYELLTASLPIGRFPEPSGTPGVGPAWDAPILCALSREPIHRFPSVNALRDAFDGATRTRRVSRPLPAPPEPAPATRSLAQHAVRAAMILSITAGSFGAILGGADWRFGHAFLAAGVAALLMGRTARGRAHAGVLLATFVGALGVAFAALPELDDHISHAHRRETLGWAKTFVLLGLAGFVWAFRAARPLLPARVAPPPATARRSSSGMLIAGGLGTLALGACLVFGLAGAAVRQVPPQPRAFGASAGGPRGIELGQRYVFSDPSGGQVVYLVRGTTRARGEVTNVAYDVETYQRTSSGLRMKGPSVRRELDIEEAPEANVIGHERLIASGRVFDCRVEQDGDLRLWRAMDGDDVAFPGIVRISQDGVVVRDLLRIESR